MPSGALTTIQTKLIFDYRKKEGKTHIRAYDGAKVEQVNSFRFLGLNITEHLLWSSHISTLTNETALGMET